MLICAKNISFFVDNPLVLPYNKTMTETKTRYHLNNIYTENPLPFGDIRLVQIGRRYCESGEIISAHAHLNWFELTIVTHGEGIVVTNGEETPVKSGDIYLSFPCDVHELRASESERLEYDFFSFYSENEEINGELQKLTQAYRRGETRIFRDEKIAFLIGNAILEFSVRKPYSKEISEHIFQQILIYLIRDFNAFKQNAKNVSDAEILCLQLMSYIDTHLYQIQRLEDVAPQFGYNYSYLSALFKRTTGKTLFDYYSNRRLETAKALLLEKKKKIGEIADMLRYASPFSFSKAFKDKYGISPKNMQKKL